MYRLISVVTMVLQGCVGSGRIANENRGFGVLLGRLLYTTTTVGWLLPTVLKANKNQWVSHFKPVFNVAKHWLTVRRKHTGKNAYQRYAEVEMAVQLCISWLFIFLSRAHSCLPTPFHPLFLSSHPSLFSHAFPRFLPSRSTRHLTRELTWLFPISKSLMTSMLVTSLWDLFTAIRAINLQYWVSDL